jgi:hypothetical protein
MKDIVYYMFITLAGVFIGAFIMWLFIEPINNDFIFGCFLYFCGVAVGRIHGPTVKWPF